MSLEQKIEELTEAIGKLTAVVQAQGGAPVNAEKPAPKTKKAAPKKEAVKQEATQVEEAQPETSEEPTIDYETVKEETIKTVKEFGRDAVVNTLAGINDTYVSAKDLKPEEYAAYLEALKNASNDMV